MLKLSIALLLALTASAGQFEVDQLHARVKKGEATEAQLDKVCAQKDCIASRLYWFTDFDEAKRAAQETGKPILVLHLLGRLDEELSCANSRFFRTTLYSDESIASLMRDDFILYWHSVRPVPRITIEFGDGRKIQQTITGNSAHYLLASDGTVLDALPGMYSPVAFRETLVRWVDLSRRPGALRSYHRDRIAAIKAHWTELSARSGVLAQALKRPKALTAEAATAITVSKAVVDRPVLASMQFAASMRALEPADWEVVGSLEAETVQFSEGARQLIRKKQFGAAEPQQGELEALIANLQNSVAADTVFNECALHAEIHQWFLRGQVTDLASLNTRIYDQLFLTPESDPWLGLKQPTIFTAIEN
ncbi:MAG TPA: hypothetical protein VKB93_00710 [Thermoanaerobaculia bacterium]|nr:hypothetical protein [Thermoanaerobaculia bacterium]